MVLSVIAMSGLSAVSVQAAASSGDLIKMAGNASVYYLGADGKRYVFPNSTTYFSWYSDFSGVVTIPAAELQGYPLGGNVTMRPGTKLVKITTDPKVYAVEPNGTLRQIQSEAQASALYGTNWNKRVVDVPDAFFTNYTTGAALASGSTPVGSLVKNASGSDVFYYDGTNYRLVSTEAAFSANKFNWSNVITAASTVSAGGSAISSSETSLVNVAQSGGVGPVVTGSGLMLSLSSQSPAAISVPQNGSRVPMAKLNLTAANDGSVSVSSLIVKRIGLSTYSNIDKVWAEKDGLLVASKKTMNSSDESILTFSPALVVAAGTTVSIDLLAGLTGSNAGTIGLSIAAASAVTATAASVSGSFPISGNLMSPTTYSVVNLGLTATSSVGNVKVGDEKVEFGHWEIGFNGTAKDVSIKSIMLKNNGVEDLSKATMNLYLEYSGNKVSTSYTVDGRFVTFYFGTTGLDLLKDDASKVLYLRGDVIAKENTGSTSFAFALNKSTDFVAYEKATGFGVNVYNNTSGSTAADNYLITNVTIDAGAVSVSKKATSPSDTTIVKGSDNVVLLANVRVDEAISADGVQVGYASVNASSTQFENARVYVNGVLLDSFDPTTPAGATKAIDSTVTFNKGDNEVKIMVKAKSTAVAGSDLKFTLTGANMFTTMNPEYVVSGNSVTTAPGGTATGAIFTVQGATLTTVRNDGYASGKTIVQSGTDISLGKFTVKATNDAVKVTAISFGANSAGTPVSASNISDMKLYVDGVQVGNVTDFGTSGVNFSSLNFSIAKDSTKNVELKGSFDSSATGNFKTTMTVNAQDSRGTSITSGNTAITTDFAMVSAGTLQIELGGSTPSEGMLASKVSEQEVAQFKFTAINDSANLTEINVINTPLASSTIASTSAGVSTADARIASIRLYDGTTLIDSFVPVNGAGKFTITGDKIKIAASGNKTLSVRVVLNNIDNDAAATNKDVHLGLTTVKFKSSSGSETTQSAATGGSNGILANSFRVRKTVPTVALLALPTTILTAGDQVVSKFTVTADANGDVTLGRLVLTWATSTNSTIAGLSTSSGGVKVNGSLKNVASLVSIASSTITLDFSAATPEVITAGTSKTFEVLATLGVSGNGAESVTTKIVENAAYDTTGATGSFVWSDGASVSSNTWSNGRRVSGLTTATQVLSK
jgi:hypothetical protein